MLAPLAQNSIIGVFAFLVLVCDIIAIIEIAASSRHCIAKLLWVIFIIFFPVFGLIVYCLCGRKGGLDGGYY